MTSVYATTPPVPWRPTTFVRLVLVQAAVAVVVLGAAHGAGGRATVNDQVVWLDIAVLAAIASALTNGLWLLSARRLVGERRRRLLDDAADVETAPGAAASVAFAIPTMTLFHRADCRLIAGKQVVAASPAAHAKKHRQRCRWCNP